MKQITPRSFWKIKVPSRVKTSDWAAILNKLNTYGMLQTTGSLGHCQQTTWFGMAILPLLPANYSGFLHQGSPYLPLNFPAPHATRIDCHKAVSLAAGTICKTKVKYSFKKHFGTRVVMSAARNDDRLSFDDHLPQEPYWLSLIKEALWGLKALCVFLVEQPSQLKYIEWPSFRSTLRTATLTLVLVALLIVALSSVDSGLCYLLAFFLRKSS